MIATLNTIPPSQPESAAERTARHMRQCAEMADLAAQLARHFAAQALATTPEEPPTAEPQPDPTAEPQSEPAPQPLAMPAPAAPRPRAPYFRVPGCKQIHPALIFTHVVATMRACISLEASLAAGTVAAPTRAGAPTLNPDPRREKLQKGFACVSVRNLDRDALRRDANARIETMLAADTAQQRSMSEIFCDICDSYGPDIDLSQVPDEYLHFSVGKIDRNIDIKTLIEQRAHAPP